MRIKQQVWLATLASILLLGSMIIISSLYLEGIPRILASALGAGGVLIGIGLIFSIHRNIDHGLEQITNISRDIAEETFNPAAAATVRKDEFGLLAATYYKLAADLHHRTAQERELRLKAEEQAWINTHVSEMAMQLQGSVHLQTAARVFIGRLAAAVGGSYGAVYLKQGDQLNFAAGYAFDESAGRREPIQLGSGLVGQCALDQQMIELQELPEHYIKVHSALGEASPSSLLVVPILHEQEVVAVIELAALHPFGYKEHQLIERTGQNMGVLINTLAGVARIEELLSETRLQKDELEAQTEELLAQTDQLQDQGEELRQQTEELYASNLELKQQMEITSRQSVEIKAQADELSAANRDMQKQLQLTERQKAEIADQAEELQAQTNELLNQKEELLAQTEELQVQKEELETQTEELLTQKEELAAANDQLLLQVALTEQQKEEIQAQAQEIFMAAQYKSEFLANVSHELRTPLNSLLILSQILAENKESNLEAKQLEYVHTIFSAGKDLLQLIDEILDLAKLEVGKMTPVMEPVALQDLSNHVFRHFEQQAKKKNLRFDVHSDSRLPDHLMTDGHRLQQIINNLLSNAIKFTPEQAC